MLLAYRERLVIINDSDTFKSRHVCLKNRIRKKPASDWNDWQKKNWNFSPEVAAGICDPTQDVAAEYLVAGEP